ncbi:MAG TPA: DNA-3-methyladenine glycosylase I [Gammaproteobacteria bacterium]|nr:DNA-3-methyladenine glycosylase I [Gammaproteobacteria bacterium]
MKTKNKTKIRCAWVSDDPFYIDYHDKEWGRPIYDERLLFEFLNLEGMQAGLSWLTILKKREHYRKVFNRFDAKKIVKYDSKKIAALLADPGIIRNRLKIQAIITNAKAFLALKAEGQSFSDYLWAFVNKTPIRAKLRTTRQLPTSSAISDQLSKDLKKRGFKFVGTTICYAFMQAVGMINDHTEKCFCYRKER